MAGGKRENKRCVLPAGFGQCRSGEKVGQKNPSESGCKHMKPSAHRVLTGNSCFYSIFFFKQLHQEILTEITTVRSWRGLEKQDDSGD